MEVKETSLQFVELGGVAGVFIKFDAANTAENYIESILKTALNQIKKMVLNMKEGSVLKRELYVRAADRYKKGKPCSCKYCDQNFYCRLDLVAHQSKKHSLLPIKVGRKAVKMCPSCGRLVHNLSLHIRTRHSQLYSGILAYCSHCEETYPMDSDHASTCKFSPQCPDCKKTFTHWRGMMKHRRVVHQGELIQCTTCEKTYHDNQSLRKHVEAVHLKLKRMCPLCGSTVSCLSTHMNSVHSDIRNFPCDMCDKKFKSNYDRTRHRECVHLKNKSSCPLCGKQISNLNQHIRVVHKQIKFTCTLCTKKYNTKSELNKHIKNVHPDAADLNSDGTVAATEEVRSTDLSTATGINTSEMTVTPSLSVGLHQLPHNKYDQEVHPVYGQDVSYPSSKEQRYEGTSITTPVIPPTSSNASQSSTFTFVQQEAVSVYSSKHPQYTSSLPAYILKNSGYPGAINKEQGYPGAISKEPGYPEAINKEPNYSGDASKESGYLGATNKEFGYPRAISKEPGYLGANSKEPEYLGATSKGTHIGIHTEGQQIMPESVKTVHYMSGTSVPLNQPGGGSMKDAQFSGSNVCMVSSVVAGGVTSRKDSHYTLTPSGSLMISGIAPAGGKESQFHHDPDDQIMSQFLGKHTYSTSSSHVKQETINESIILTKEDLMSKQVDYIPHRGLESRYIELRAVSPHTTHHMEDVQHPDQRQLEEGHQVVQHSPGRLYPGDEMEVGKVASQELTRLPGRLHGTGGSRFQPEPIGIQSDQSQPIRIQYNQPGPIRIQQDQPQTIRMQQDTRLQMDLDRDPVGVGETEMMQIERERREEERMLVGSNTQEERIEHRVVAGEVHLEREAGLHPMHQASYLTKYRGTEEDDHLERDGRQYLVGHESAGPHHAPPPHDTPGPLHHEPLKSHHEAPGPNHAQSSHETS